MEAGYAGVSSSNQWRGRAGIAPRNAKFILRKGSGSTHLSAGMRCIGPTEPGSTSAAGDADARVTCRSVANIVKQFARRAGFDAAIYSGHSLRSGFLTSAAGRGASIFKMMDQSGHKSIDTLRGYVRDAELFKDHAGAGLL
jgi:integrase